MCCSQDGSICESPGAMSYGAMGSLGDETNQIKNKFFFFQSKGKSF